MSDDGDDEDVRAVPRGAVLLDDEEPEAEADDSTDDAVSEPAERVALASAEGARRLDRSWPDLIATGIVGGIDVSVGVIALILILHRTDNEVVASLGFALGFVAIALGRSELITENFLVPVATVNAGIRPFRSLVRLWSGTLVANLVGGLVVTALFAYGWASELEAAVGIGENAMETGIGGVSFVRSMVAGLFITLMTWMQSGVANSVGGRVVAAFGMGFMIIYSHSHHVVVGTFEVAAGIMAGGEWTWLELGLRIPWWLLGNLVGGLGFVTVLRLVQARSTQQAAA